MKLMLTFNSTLAQDELVEGKTTFGSRIKTLRLEAKLSQRDLADRLAKRLKGFDFTYLSKIENDRLVPSASAILALAAELKGNRIDAGCVLSKPRQALLNHFSSLFVLKGQQRDRRGLNMRA